MPVAGILFILTLVSGSAQAADVEARKQALHLLDQAAQQHGDLRQARAETLSTMRNRTASCAYCHGAEGNSERGDVPSLAGENAVYLLQRLIRLQEGHNQPRMMHRVVQRSNPEELTSLALFYTGFERSPVEFDATLAKQGAPLYQALCQHCHEADGRGAKGYASLAGQQPRYVADTLTRFRDQRGWRDSPQMRSITEGLSDTDIQALAAYVSGLHTTR